MKSSKHSLYRTQNIFDTFIEVKSQDEVISALQLAKTMGKNAYCLGNGSNTLFINKHVKSLILKNKLPRQITQLSDDRFYISSSTLVSYVLKYCLNLNRECFYYLASVPAEIGGALAMNAGQGKLQGAASIMDFVESVHYIKDGNSLIESPAKLGISYRQTIFTGQSNMFILGATFKFPVGIFSHQNPIQERIEWAKQSQDLSKPNCGSVFKEADSRIMYRFRGISLLGASFSKKTDNWIVNKSSNPRGINLLIFLVRMAHRCLRLKCAVEVIRVP